MTNRPSSNAKWLYESPIHSDVEAKLRRLLVELGNDGRIHGIQVCAYKDGKVIIDTAAGVMGEDDPRPVQPDTLFPVFSVTKGITAGLMHWLADKGYLKLDDNVANIWPEFGTNGKEQIKVHHVLNHTAGLHNALAGLPEETLCDWDECLKRIALATPETEPGSEQIYHYLSYGWLCGGIIEHASGKKFQEVLEEAFVRPLNAEGELYIGIPPGVESRLATVAFDIARRTATTTTTTTKRQPYGAMPSSLTPDVLASFVPLCNNLNVRRAILPASNGNFSARALARYYAALVDGGKVPPQHSSTLPTLGTHPHRPTFPSKKTSEKQIDSTSSTQPTQHDLYIRNPETDDTNKEISKIFTNSKSKIHDAFLGSGDYKDLILPSGKFGLGFKRVKTTDGLLFGFGHAGLGGSTGYCDVNNRFSIVVILNMLSFGALTAEIIRFVCSELDLLVPEDYSESREFTDKPLIN